MKVEHRVARGLRQAGGHRLWTGQLHPKGYGLVVTSGGRRAAVHRLVYGWEVEPIPPGRQLVNTCGIQACAEPSHWRPRTRARALPLPEGYAAWSLPRERCPEGHELTGGNLVTNEAGDQLCRRCLNAPSPSPRAEAR